MKWFLVIAALAAGVAIGIVYQKSVTYNTVNVLVGVPSERALVNPSAGDVIKWRDKKGPVTVSWPFGSPCDPTNAVECHVLQNAKNQVFAYECPSKDKCDPDVPVGSDISLPQQTLTGLDASSPTPVPVDVGCLGGTTIGTRPPSPSVSLRLNAAVVWQGLGNATSNWSIDNTAWQDSGGHAATVCQSGNIDYNQPRCTLAGGLVAGTYTYSLTSSACTTKPTDRFSITVSQ